MSVGLISAVTVREHFLNAPFDSVGRSTALALLAQRTGPTQFRYIVTPNVDHVVRLSEDPSLVPCYEGAWLSLCDSKPIVALSRLLRGGELLHLPGSTLTEILFRDLIRPGDRIALVVGDAEIAATMQATFPGIDFQAFVAPPNVDRDPSALSACAAFVAGSTARFTFIAIGSPRSERIAFQASLDPEAKGIGLCVGASLEFLLGRKRRAPIWMQRAGLEWLHRLGSEPRRLWRRYLLRILPLGRLVLIEFATLGALRRAGPGRPIKS
ncbi:WecB/TagA/CpsF family glycosyltransferase [Methylobacterium sp. BTF04]|uniref:WecB/TagA/CpsF family glycosyltransferase n=1 Tax=Methylobacterium sp. BTF04 TaxID=2708300 RepID=UPI0013D3693B|nr:WecB/TagA/CpsF family glycosyltransferase [Methylobacterium sp. BTF04]NEU13493.1 WecB/TagA/CpsF family glycosyltransferase [Methylobacterium sp. BTF04]